MKANVDNQLYCHMTSFFSTTKHDRNFQSNLGKQNKRLNFLNNKLPQIYCTA